MNLQALTARLRAAQRGPRSRRGMTLMEIMIVITIIVLLTGVLMWGIMRTAGQAYAETARLQIGKIEQDVVLFKMKKKKVPDSLQELYKDEPIPKDPWGNEYVLGNGSGKKGFEIMSYGADGKEGGTGADEDIKGSEQ